MCSPIDEHNFEYRDTVFSGPERTRKSGENRLKMTQKWEKNNNKNTKLMKNISRLFPLVYKAGKMLAEVDFLDTFTKCLNHQGQSACL